MSKSRSVQASKNGVAPPLATMIAPHIDPELEKQTSSRTESPAPLAIPREDDRITPGAGGRLIVPREKMEDDYSAGEELDLASGISEKPRKPDRHEWIRLFPDRGLPTRLLILRQPPKSMVEEYFYVVPELRGEIADELRRVRVIPYYSLSARCYCLWVMKLTDGNSWYESLQALIEQGEEFFGSRQIRVKSDKDKSRYHVKHKPLDRPVDAPPHPTEEMLGAAIGEDHFIRDRSHPVYQSLIEGEELT